MECHWKFLGGGGLNSQNFKAKYEAKLEFLRGEGGGWVQNKKTFHGGEYGYFLELLLKWKCSISLPQSFTSFSS